MTVRYDKTVQPLQCFGHFCKLHRYIYFDNQDIQRDSVRKHG